MLEKLKDFLIKTTANIPTDAPLWVLVIFAALLVLEILLINAGWLYNWYDTGRADVPVMINFLTVLIGAQFIAAVTFVAKAFADKDGNGVPDAIDSEYSNNKIGFKDGDIK